MQRVNFCFAKVINFLSEGYQNVCPGSGVAFGYTSCFMPTDKDLQVSENLIELYSNQQTLFGRGSIDRLVPLLAANPQPTLLFSCRSFLNGPVYAGLRESLTPLLIGTEIVSHEASPQEIDAWVARWRGQARRVVAIGGGSVLDAAKAFSALVEHPLPTLRYMEKVGDSKISGATLPLIAIPTTAGTGSEVTQNAVITDTQVSKVKASLRHNNFVPHTAILDPQLLADAPDKVLAYCAIDAFTHLFEAYLSRKGNLFSQQNALNGLQLFMQAWPYLNQDDSRGDAAREAMMMASWLGGVSLSSAGLGVIHGIAGELGAIKPFHHGEVCGRLLFPFLDVLAESAHPEQQRLMAALSERLLPDETAPPALALKAWLQQQAIVPFWLEGPTLAAEEVDWIVARANSKNGWVNYDPATLTEMITAAWRVV